MIIGITGTNGAGKGTVVEILKEKGFTHYSVSGYLGELLREKGEEVNRDAMIRLANELRTENSPSYLAEVLYNKALREGAEFPIIESLRTEGEVTALRKKGGFYLLAVDASPEIRYNRITNRGSNKDAVSFQQFMEQEKREMHSDDANKQNLRRCIEMADYILINNDSIQELRKNICSFMDNL
jgi:dephospho-CoA kinase